MSIHIRADIHVDTSTVGSCEVILPEDEDWIWKMRAADEDNDGFSIRLDNYPMDGSVNMVALSLGPYYSAVESPDDRAKHLEVGPVSSGSVFALLLDAPKLAELIAALQLMQTHFPE